MLRFLPHLPVLYFILLWMKGFCCLSSAQGREAVLRGLFILGAACSWVCLCLFQSSLLSAVLGELWPSQGQVTVHGRIAYVPQQPWLFPGTVRSNILFGKKYEKDRYEKVLKACALEEVSNDFWVACTQISNNNTVDLTTGLVESSFFF